MAQHTLAVLRRLFSQHAGRSDDFRSPIVRGMNRVKPSERRRQRTLSDNEIRALWWAAEASPRAFGYFMQFALLTACIRNEAARMGRQEVTGDDWVIPQERYKTSKELVIPLSPAAKPLLDIIEAGGPMTIGGVFYQATVRGLRRGPLVLTKSGSRLGQRPRWR
jgi:integrase